MLLRYICKNMLNKKLDTDKNTLLRIITGMISAIFVVEIVFLGWACKHHLDFTDESFYVLSSLYPSAYATRFSDFGYLNASIMKLVGKNLYALRVSGLFILLVSSFGMVYQSMLYLEKQLEIKLPQSYRYLWILTGMIASTGVYFWGMTTPSYNFYALIGILIACTGFLSILYLEKKNIFSIFLLSIGVLIIYIGKPTSAVIFVFFLSLWTGIGFLYKIIQKREIFISLFLAGAFLGVLFFIYIILIYGSINKYLAHLTKTRQLLSQVGYSVDMLKNSIFTSLAIELDKFYFLIPYSLLITIFLVYYRKKQKRIGSPLNQIDKLYFYGTGFFIVFGGFLSHKGFSWKWAWGYMAIFYGCLAYFIFYIVRIGKNVQLLSFFISLLIIISFSYVFGTNNSYSIALSGAYILIAIGLMSITLFIHKSNQSILALMVSVFLIALFSLSTLGYFFVNPYRSQAKLYQHRYYLDVLKGVYVDKFHFDYAIEMQQIAKQHPEIQNHDYLIDISGKSAANIILNKKYFGQSWVVWGRTDTYYHFANSVLKTIPIHLIKKSMILTNEALPTERILKDIPIHLTEDYICIGRVFAMPEKEHHLLWIPKQKQ